MTQLYINDQKWQENRTDEIQKKKFETVIISLLQSFGYPKCLL